MEVDALTRLRLLATSRVVRAAQALLEAEHTLATACFADPLPPTEDHESLLKSVRQARTHFVEAARSALQLRDPTGSDHYGSFTSWHEMRAIIRDAEKQDTEKQDKG
jgi:hypothetical protein